MTHSMGKSIQNATPRPRFNIKMISYQYRKSHCGDKMILWPSYLHNGISYTGKMTSLYWIRALHHRPGIFSLSRSINMDRDFRLAIITWQRPEARLNIKTVFSGVGISITKMIRYLNNRNTYTDIDLINVNAFSNICLKLDIFFNTGPL